MANATIPFPDWISSLPTWRGLRQLSPERPYAHAEEHYNEQYGVEESPLTEGQGLCALLEREQVDTRGAALEIGCGTGYLTVGLARHYPGADLLVTDPSEKFLRLTQAQFEDRRESSPRLHFAVLNADDLALLPAGMFSVIAMRSTLHHILEVDKFVVECGRILRPGGALVMGAEPCEYGYFLMGMLGQSIGPVLRAAGVAVKPEWEKQIANLTDTIRFYLRRDLDKTTAEDKHLFNPHELAELGLAHDLRAKFLPNAAFADFAPPYEKSFVSFSVFFMTYLQYCLLFDAELLAHIRQHLAPQLHYIDSCYRGQVGPATSGIFLFQKMPART